MLTIVVMVTSGAILFSLLRGPLGTPWAFVIALAFMFAGQLAVGLWVRRKIGAMQRRMALIQEEMTRKLNRMVQQFQQRPSGNMKQAQQQLEDVQREAVRKMLLEFKSMEPFYRWNLMLKKQIDTSKMMLHFQLRDFDKVDELLPNCMFLEPRSIAVKLARMHQTNHPDIGKFFHKSCRKLKGQAAVLPYSAYAWILLHANKEEEARALLVEAKKKTDNPVIVENYGHLANGRTKQFSNAALGDEWYGLFLEEPKAAKPQRVRARF